jgi:hypothetical protein
MDFASECVLSENGVEKKRGEEYDENEKKNKAQNESGTPG